MNCPFCDEQMREVKGKYVCPGGGRLLTTESGPCPYAGKTLTKNEIKRIEIALLDLDTGD